MSARDDSHLYYGKLIRLTIDPLPISGSMGKITEAGSKGTPGVFISAEDIGRQ